MQTQERKLQRAVANIRSEAFREQLEALGCDERVHSVGACSVMRLPEGFFIFGQTRGFVNLAAATAVILRAAALRGTVKTG